MTSSEIRPFKETGEHSYHRRAFAHNYFAPFIYHIIIKKENMCEKFGEVSGDAKIESGEDGCAYIRESQLGKIIAKAVVHLPYKFSILKLHQFSVMPDHVHLLLEVKDWSPYHLDHYIENLMESITEKYSKLKGKTHIVNDVFQPGYCDKPLLLKISLDGWYKYIKENPHRLAMRKQYPDFFKRVRNLRIGDKAYEAYGNLFLFRNPDKLAVKMSSKYSEEFRAKKFKFYNQALLTGSILVSPFIHQDEKKIRLETEEKGGNIILIEYKKFPEIYKPFEHEYKQCCQGKLLIISMGYPPKTPLSKKICKEMNELAELICRVC